MSKVKTKFVCQNCGYECTKWLGKCPNCNEWNSLVEEVRETAKKFNPNKNISLNYQSINSISVTGEIRVDTKINEFNHALGGGIVPGSLILVGGDPGIGKSTLLLQAAREMANTNHKVLYISGEESVNQIKYRADRLGVNSDNLYILIENQIEKIEEQIKQSDSKIIIIDSIQTMYYSQITSSQGSVAQVRECTSILMRLAKSYGTAILIVGHVTKQGEIAGPRVLEHMVDVVLYFEGERHHTYRILRTVKNRFGSTNEIGIFEMKEMGLVEVNNPSEFFLSQKPSGVAGSSVAASLEGTRPILVEVQALLSNTNFITPKRMATGVDQQRVALIIAVLEKRNGVQIFNQDVYVNVAGGIKLVETGIDLSIAISIASSLWDKVPNPNNVYIGEIGLTGEVRGVSRIEQRVCEVKKLGFKRVIIPEKNLKGWNSPEEIKVIGVKTVAEALDIAFMEDDYE